MCGIEAILNSRPLCEIPNDQGAIIALTPAHFAIQRTLLFPPKPSDPTASFSVTKRWNQLQNLLLSFWEIFPTEYLNTLQTRRKWQTTRENVKCGDLVVLKESGALIEKWKLGRITNVFPDKKVRQVSLRTGTGNITHRAVHTLVPLTPLNQVEDVDNDSQEDTIQHPEIQKDDTLVPLTTSK